jgi:uncharacterized Zn finger protein (UPF0148 family)
MTTDLCADCGAPLIPERDGVCDDNVCQPCNDRIEAEAEAHWQAMSPEEKAALERASRRGLDKAMSMIRAADEKRKRAEELLSPEHSKRVARKLHDEGKEVTPDQVAEARTSGLEKIKAAMEAKGYKMPETEVGMMVMLMDVFGKGEN